MFETEGRQVGSDDISTVGGGGLSTIATVPALESAAVVAEIAALPPTQGRETTFPDVSWISGAVCNGGR